MMGRKIQAVATRRISKTSHHHPFPASSFCYVALLSRCCRSCWRTVDYAISDTLHSCFALRSRTGERLLHSKVARVIVAQRKF